MDRKTLKIILWGLLAVVLGLSAGFCIRYFTDGKKKAEMRHLVILHVNDTHSHFEPVRSGEYAGMGGIIERAAYVDSVRRFAGPENVLLLHAGDFDQGTTYFSELGGTVEVQGLNALGYDVVTLGNHEFDNGIDALGVQLSGLEMPVVVCNYDFSPFEAGKYIQPFVIVEKAGMKIGVIGVLCNLKDMVAGDIANRIPEFDLYPTVQKYADQLRPQCDLVIVLSHIGYTEHNPGDITDSVLCANTRNIDLFVGGHSHTFLEEAQYHPNLDGKKIPIVQDGWMGAFVGRFDVTL